MAVAGLEKFAHLEDKIYRTVELCKTLKQHNESLEKEVAGLRRELSAHLAEKDRLETQIERLLADRDAMRLKVEAMLDAIAVLELESEAMKK
jgi:regulator of replication initiation timing